MRVWTLRKWYLDCVADDGTVWIGYWGDVAVGPFRLQFASSLIFEHNEANAKNDVRSPAEPRHRISGVTWSVPRLGLDVQMSP
ncbi:MAG: hypothetical protein ACXW2X_06935, partial [Thermoanaerobaculia bacterium]